MLMDARVAIVTGSATGVGAATALRLANQGWNVVINYTRSGAEANETAEACAAAGADVLTCQADVSDDEQCREMVQQTVARWGRLDGLVNSAGRTKFVAHQDLDGLSAQDFLDIYAVNVVGIYQMVRAVAPHMKEQGSGAIVNVSSIAGLDGVGSSIAYSASKGALNTMTLALARVLGPEVRINTVAPGVIEGRWLRNGLGEASYERMKVERAKNVALGKVATADDVAETIVWLLESANLLTGEVLRIDAGGRLGAALAPRQ
jgi:3-oxoacyl-[acyl-carrier protein] reductase